MQSEVKATLQKKEATEARSSSALLSAMAAAAVSVYSVTSGNVNVDPTKDWNVPPLKQAGLGRIGAGTAARAVFENTASIKTPYLRLHKAARGKVVNYCALRGSAVAPLRPGAIKAWNALFIRGNFAHAVMR